MGFWWIILGHADKVVDQAVKEQINRGSLYSLNSPLEVELAEELGMGDKVEWKIGKNAYYIDGEIFPLEKGILILSFSQIIEQVLRK